MWSLLKDFFKFNVAVMVVVTSAIGYGIGLRVEQGISFSHFLFSMAGIFILTTGSLSLNEVQEWKYDRLMPRTSKRPIPEGKLTVRYAIVISAIHLILGSMILFKISYLAGVVGLSTAFFYNVLYTMFWKRKWAFGAVPGAIPGALPLTLGYACINNYILSSESIYLFMILFLWQMPHFWSLAIRFKEDYASGGFPVLPLIHGDERTKYYIALYTFVYVGLALISPLFIHAKFFYMILVVPFCIKLLYEFAKYFRSTKEKAWLPFFLWTNFSLLAFLFAPLLDKWYLFFTGTVTL